MIQGTDNIQIIAFVIFQKVDDIDFIYTVNWVQEVK